MAPLCGLPLPTSSPRNRTSRGGGAGDWHGSNSNGGYDDRKHSGSQGKRPLSRKIVVVGDGAAGKTSLLNVFVSGHFPTAYEPTVFENHTIEMVVDDTAIDMSLWDTAGQEDFDRLRSLSYSDTHVILLCYAVDQPSSLENVESKWIDEILEHCPGVKICLVALKCDLREDPLARERLGKYGEEMVEYELGLTVAKRIRASRYLECSAKHDRGVREAFEEAARVAITAQRRGETRGSKTDEPERGSTNCVVMSSFNPQISIDALTPRPSSPLSRPQPTRVITMAYSGHGDPSFPPPSHFQEGNRPFRQGSSANSSTHSIDEQPSSMPYVNYASTPSLPRYDSSRGSATNLANPSPLNPAATRSSATGYSANPVNPNNRYSTFGYNGQGNPAGAHHGPHPLANAVYMESSPTLAGSEVMSPSEEKIRDEKMRLGGADQLGEYIAPSTSSGNSSSSASAPLRRGPKPTGLRALYRLWSGANLADSGKDERHVKLPRLGYLDGLKFLAAWVVLNGTFFNATLSDNDYTAIQRDSPLYIVRSTGLGICLLLILLGRSLITPLWDVPSATAGPGPNQTKPNTALISWARLTRAMLVRPFRFILPVLAIVALQWGLAANGQTSNCNNVGMDEPYWGLISRFAGYCTLVFDLFTTYEYDTLAGQTFAGNLWTNAWFFQSSYAVYCTHLMLGNLSSNRYWVYGIICFFSWTTYNYFFVALLGLVIADMHAHGHLHTIRTKWPAYLRISLHAFLIVIALVFQWVPVIRDNVNSGLATINVSGHPEITFCDALFVACWLFCIETSGLAQSVFGNVVGRTLGKLAPGMYLLAPAITYTIVPDIALRMDNNGASASSILGTTWVALFGIVVALSIAFHFIVELPSKMIGEVVCEMLENWDGQGSIRSKAGKLTKNAGGAAQKK
ncbi:hypothetical protein JCM10212_000132 [Sporobolomyces blumeae]